MAGLFTIPAGAAAYGLGKGIQYVRAELIERGGDIQASKADTDKWVHEMKRSQATLQHLKKNP